MLKDMSLLKTEAYINGEWVAADSGARFAVTNPATGEHIADVADVGADETRRAIEAADAAWPAWRAKTAKERSIILRRWFDLIMENLEDLATLLVAEMGKPIAEATGEIKYGANYIEWFAEEAKRVYGDVIPGPTPGTRLMAIKQPIGVVAAITPWNFPNAMLARKAAPALAAGCVMVSKPAEDTPLSALALAELADRAGVPAGVLNVVPTKNPIPVGGELTSNPLVRKISFTGSTEVGKILLKQGADTVKRMTMELGGNAPFIVFDDADVDAAVAGAMVSKYRNAGQTCVCANRIYVQDGVYDEFVAKFSAEVNTLTVGNGMDGANVGPLINAEAIEKVEQLVAGAVNEGAEITLGGQRHELGGTFYQPTVVTGVTQSMEIARNEIFGPVSPIYRFSTEEEVIEMANDTEFGLATYFYARDIGRIWRVGEALEYGIVGVNTGAISAVEAPFGGIKESGMGREGSKYGLDDYLEIKYMCVAGL